MAQPGQGNSLPSGLGFRGQWIVEARIFLFEPDRPSEDITCKADLPDGGWCIGLDAAHVAQGLSVGVADLMAENRAGRLAIVVGPGKPAPGAASALNCRLTLGGREMSVTVQRYDHR